jgi:hypothetical protein
LFGQRSEGHVGKRRQPDDDGRYDRFRRARLDDGWKRRVVREYDHGHDSDDGGHYNDHDRCRRNDGRWRGQRDGRT